MAMVPVKRTFPKQFMLEVLYDDVGEVVSDKIVGKRRWSDAHELIFAFEARLYRAEYERGATENQHEGPWEYETEVECTEMERYEKTVQAYRPVLIERPDQPAEASGQ